MSDYTPEQLATIRELRNGMETGGAALDDKEASQNPLLYPVMKYDGTLIKYGTRIQWVDPAKGIMVKRAAQDLWDSAENNPDNAPNLWDDIEYHDGVRVIPAVFTPGKAFAKDEEGWWPQDGNVYVSQIAANVTQPTPGDERYWKRRE